MGLSPGLVGALSLNAGKEMNRRRYCEPPNQCCWVYLVGVAPALPEQAKTNQASQE